MKKITLLLVLLLVLGMGCSDNPVMMKAEQTSLPADFSLPGELAQAKRKHGVQKVMTIATVCEAPKPLPVVGYTIGEVRGPDTLRVPVYMHTQGRRSQGGVLFTSYDVKHLQFLGVEKGPAWDNAAFTSVSVNDQIPGRAIFLIIGWEEWIEGGLRFARGIPETDEPWAYMVFAAVQPGKSKIEWDDPNPSCGLVQGIEYCFFRRGEMLLDLDEAASCVWDVVDYYTRDGVNTTGTMTVDPGYAVVTGAKD